MKSNITNAKYQSTFLPILSKAETDIKELIIKSALLLRSKAFLRLQIKQIIEVVEEKLPPNIKDRDSYVKGLWFSSERMIKKYYDRMIIMFFAVANILKRNEIIRKIPKNQLELIKIVDKVKSKDVKEKSIEMADLYEKGKQFKIDTIYEQKGTPNVEDYHKKVKEYIGDVAKTEFAPAEEGKKKITMWQKAELDIRHEAQTKMLEDLVAQGVVYAWTSSHPDCSKRCQKWQGKLFDIIHDADNGQFKMKDKVEGRTVYSLKAVTSVVDKYGYKNNIIVGFNCRHRLVPFTPKSVPPTDYDAEDIKRNREINAKLRAYEREIRRLKRLAIFYKTIDKKQSKMYMDRAKALTEEYKAFAEEHGFAWLPYRLEV